MNRCVVLTEKPVTWTLFRFMCCKQLFLLVLLQQPSKNNMWLVVSLCSIDWWSCGRTAARTATTLPSVFRPEDHSTLTHFTLRMTISEENVCMKPWKYSSSLSLFFCCNVKTTSPPPTRLRKGHCPVIQSHSEVNKIHKYCTWVKVDILLVKY